MDIQNAMSTDVYSIESSKSTTEAAVVMRDSDVGALVVISKGSVVGVITDRDLKTQCLSQSHDSSSCTVSVHMTAPAKTTAPGTDMLNAIEVMTQHRIRRLPVISDDNLVGLVSVSDIALVYDESLGHVTNTIHRLLNGIGAGRSA